ncbi:Acetate and butyrate kinase [Rhodopirellula baltica WH47]|uniref:Acetate and butyrate kinase n=1 Tax=Rhodopirellula baltica WH47 TaxID=991778 RepID=F2B122_RHOBT|nr:Acetate and butyrate kinase [Rhodopirellula baltica WH47]
MRRYGFHGLSYEFLMHELGRVAGTEAAKGRVVLAHLGNGTSLAAERDGKSIDTTMSFAPTSGVPMSTRSGDLDPSLCGYFARTEDMTSEQFNEMVNAKSGLLGISETSSDIRDLLDLETQDERARGGGDFLLRSQKANRILQGRTRRIGHARFRWWYRRELGANPKSDLPRASVPGY